MTNQNRNPLFIFLAVITSIVVISGSIMLMVQRSSDNKKTSSLLPPIEQTQDAMPNNPWGDSSENDPTLPSENTIRVSGCLTWQDDNDRDGIRPETITVHLMANGNRIASKTVSSRENWSWDFGTVHKYDANNEIVYNLLIDSIKNYTADIDNFNISCHYAPTLVEVSGQKSWNDNNNRDGKRPDSITVRLLANGTEIRCLTVSAENNWSWNFDGLYKYENGSEIVYTISENEIEGYTTVMNGWNSSSQYTPLSIDINGNIFWHDDDNRDQKRPSQVTVRLYANGNELHSQIVSSKSDWKWEFTDLDKFSNGTTIQYYISVDSVDNYTITVQDFDSYITYTPEKTHLSGNLTWNDDGNRDGKRPESITVTLLANNVQVQTIAIFEKDNWTWQFNDLAKFQNGQPITYSVTYDTIENYTVVENKYNLIATYIPKTKDITGTVIWKDDSNRDGKRPESIRINLFSNGVQVATTTTSESDEWSWAFYKLNMYSNGVAIDYHITVSVLEEYTQRVENNTITMDYTPETVQIDGFITWEDHNNNDGKRPDSVNLYLYANGTKAETLVLNATNNWTWIFSSLKKFENGKPIIYTLRTEDIKEYVTTVNGYEITCSYTAKTCTVKGQFTWNDNENQDNKRPDSITVSLFANGTKIASQIIRETDNWSWDFEEMAMYQNGNVIAYYITVSYIEGYIIQVNGYHATGTYTPEKVQINSSVTWLDQGNQDGIRPSKITVYLYADGQRVSSSTASQNNNWSVSFSELDKNKNGKIINYTISAGSIDGYDLQIDNHTILASHTPEKITVRGNKIWNDDNNRDGLRPNTITVLLFADGQKIDSMTVSAQSNWAFTFKDLPKNKNGKTILYTIGEIAVSGYTSVVNGYNITGTHTPQRFTASGSVQWNDDSNRDGKRPQSLTVNLLASGVKIASQTITASTNWTFSFSNIYKYENGTTAKYTILVDSVKGYTITTSGYQVTAKYSPEKISVSGSIIWKDDNDRDSLRPKNVTLYLWANGIKIKEFTVSADNALTWKIDDLNRYQGGKEIVYTVTEKAIISYTTSISGLNITNEHSPKMTAISGNVLWKDDDNRDGKRPESITVYLYANGKRINSQVVNRSSNWTYTFDSLYQYENGVAISYTVDQKAIDGYSTMVDGSRLINSYTPQKTTVHGSIVWQDMNDNDGKRPSSVRINLYANGDKIDSIVLSENQTSFRFQNLNVYRAGTKIVYTIMMETLRDYTVTVNGYTITCQYAIESTSVSGLLLWNDDQNRDGKRPSTVTVNLLANGIKMQSRTISMNDGWTWDFSDLPKYDNKKDIIYSVSINSVQDYTITINGQNATAKHIPQTMSISGTITWIDGANEEGKRPSNIKINLLANGIKIDTTSVSTQTNSYSFQNVYVYQNGKKITYAVTQDKIDGYTVSIDGFKIANTLIPVVKPAQITLLKPVASGILTKENDSAIIDYSNTADGYVMVKYKEQTSTPLLAQITGPTTTYTYYIKGGEWTVFPLSDGNGSYAIKIFKHVLDDRYSIVLGQKCTAVLKDEFAPFIRPNQYVNYENAINTMNTAASILTDSMSVLEKVDKIYNYVIKNLTYDYEKMLVVTGEYLPDLDKVLKERKGICFDYAALMTGMLRSQNVPCKLVVGYADGGYHAWINVWSTETGWIDGTIYFNGTNWERLDPTYASGGMTNLDKINYVTKYIY